jgi:hypothetical protein
MDKFGYTLKFSDSKWIIWNSVTKYQFHKKKWVNLSENLLIVRSSLGKMCSLICWQAINQLLVTSSVDNKWIATIGNVVNSNPIENGHWQINLIIFTLLNPMKLDLTKVQFFVIINFSKLILLKIRVRNVKF